MNDRPSEKQYTVCAITQVREILRRSRLISARMSTQPTKKRQWKKLRAHVNPMSLISGYENPACPDEVDWEKYIPFAENHVAPTFADVGCGFGGLLEALAPRFPEKHIVGLEIRTAVVDRVVKRVERLQSKPGFRNIGVVYTNAMRYFVKFFKRHHLEKIFFCFPDPHFKKSNHRRRIVSPNLVTEYSHCLRPGGMIYTITDVLDLHEWMTTHLQEHPLFERVSDLELVDDPAIPAMHETDEAKKVVRLGGNKYVSVFRKIDDSEFLFPYPESSK